MAEYATGIETKARILAASKRLFIENGYEQTTFKDICREADTTQGSIYYHFTAKSNILQAIFAELSDDLRDGLRDIFSGKISRAVEYSLYTLASWYLFFTNDRYRSLMQSATVSRLADDFKTDSWLSVEVEDPIFDEYCYRDEPFSAEERSAIIMGGLGIMKEYQFYMADKLNRYSYEQVSRFYLNAFFGFFGMGISRVEETFNEALRLMKPLTITADNDLHVRIRRN